MPHCVQIAVDGILAGCIGVVLLTAYLYHSPTSLVGKDAVGRSLTLFSRYEIDIEALVILEVALGTIERDWEDDGLGLRD